MSCRVGVLGFLTTEDENAPGNSALWDDIAALQWVKESIQYFGGDPDLITITGQSAGGATGNLFNFFSLTYFPSNGKYFLLIFAVVFFH